MKTYYIKKDCRLCKSSNLRTVLSLNNSPLCDAYTKKIKAQKMYPLKLQQCQDCDFVQINCVINPEEIYKDYIYITTSSMGLQDHFESYAKYCRDNFGFKKNSNVLDVGSNDGTLLKQFKRFGFRTLGVEPASKVAAAASKNGIKTLSCFFNSSTANRIKEQFGMVDILTINNLFANIDDLDSFLNSICTVISEDGIVIIESSYLFNMINNMVFDFIYHEHLSYFSVLPLIKFFKKFNFELIDLVPVNTKGGSLRYVWAKTNKKQINKVQIKKLIKYEKKCLSNKNIFKIFNFKIIKLHKQLLKAIKKYKNSIIVGYGASATTTTLISHFGLANHLKYLVDDNPGKINTFSPGFNIPVYNLGHILHNKPDVIIIFAWRYSKTILNKLRKYKISSKVIIPLPTLKKVNFN